MSRYVCVEMSANGIDNRPLLTTGLFGIEGVSDRDIAQFLTPDAARQAGEQASNRRAGTTIYVPGERKAAA